MSAMHRRFAVNGRQFVHSVLLAAVLVASVMATRAASAQGTFGTLPNPITSRELMDYATRLKLSDQQKKAVESFHDQYKQEFRTLRNGEIADFLKDMRSMDKSGGIPKRDQIEAFLKRMDQLNTKIAALDSRMFDQFQTVLTDEQQLTLPRVRMARQRGRFADAQMMWISGNRNVDLSEIIAKVELTPDEFQSADPLMSQYETKLTASMTKLHDAVTHMFLDMFDMMEKQGLTEAPQDDPETQKKMMEAIQAGWRDIMRKPMEIASDISDLNLRTQKTVSAVLGPETARTFRNGFYEHAYPEASFAVGTAEALFQNALKRDELTDDQRQSVTTVRDEFRSKMDKLVEEAVPIINKQRDEMSPFDFNSEAMQQYQKSLADLQTRGGEIRKAASQALQTALGPDLSKQLNVATLDQDGMMGQGGFVGMAMAEAAVAAKEEASQVQAQAGDDAEARDELQQSWADQYLPAHITRAEVNDYIQRLHLADDEKTILQQLHKTYLDNFKVVRDNEIAAVAKAVQSMWNFDRQTGQATGPALEKIDEVYRLRKAALAAIRRVDAAFLDDVEFAVLKPEQAPLMARVRLARDRQVYNRTQYTGYFYGGGSNESSMDLSTVIPILHLNDATTASIDTQLSQYEQTVTVAFAAKYDASLDMDRAQQRLQSEMAKLQGENGNPMSYQQKYKEIMGESTTRLSQANSQISKINREALDALLASLPADAGYTLRTEFNRRAFPNIYNDATGVDRQLNEALKLADLTDEQRRKLNDLAAEYRPAYAALCDQMVQATAGRDATNFMMGDPEQMKEFQDRQEVMAKLRFDRNELNTRAIGQLKTVLTEDQIRHIGGVPEPKDGNDFGMWD